MGWIFIRKNLASQWIPSSLTDFFFSVSEGRTLELHSPDAVHSCVLRAADPAEAVAWFNTLHSALAVLTNAAIHEATRAIPDLRHIGWLLRRPRMDVSIMIF